MYAIRHIHWLFRFERSWLALSHTLTGKSKIPLPNNGAPAFLFLLGVVGMGEERVRCRRVESTPSSSHITTAGEKRRCLPSNYERGAQITPQRFWRRQQKRGREERGGHATEVASAEARLEDRREHGQRFSLTVRSG